MDALNVEVSYFKQNKKTGSPETVNLLAFLRSSKHLAKVEQVRAAQTKVERNWLKERLPGITPHGVFSYRDDKHLVKHSGLIQGDIDFQDNPYNPESIKREISKIKNVAYCGLSTSGRGLWFLIPIANPDKHAAHYAAIVVDFARLGFVLDTTVSSLSSFRYFSHDPQAYFNPDAAPYKKTIEQPTAAPIPREARQTLQQGESSPARWAAKYLIDNRVNISNGYGDHMRVAAACKYEFGEDGREIALVILGNSPEFMASRFYRDFDSHWKSFKREDGYVSTGKRLVRLAQEHKKRAAKDAPQSPAIHAPAPSALPPGYRRERFTVRATGQPIEVLLNADRYPAAWGE